MNCPAHHFPRTGPYPLHDHPLVPAQVVFATAESTVVVAEAHPPCAPPLDPAAGGRIGSCSPLELIVARVLPHTATHRAAAEPILPSDLATT